MFRLVVDFGNLADAGDRFEAAYQDGVRQMKATLDAKAATERATHDYQNRTGELEASTYASEVISIGDADEVQLGARAPYARYVAVRGLMRIDELAAEADGELAYLFAGLSRVI
jgi:hypothetical protein